MNMKQAVQLHKGLEKQYRAVLAMGEVMEEVVNLEDMRDEAKKETEKERKKRDFSRAETLKADNACVSARIEKDNLDVFNKKEIEKTKKEVSSLLIEAKQKAYSIIQEAQKEADKTKKEVYDFKKDFVFKTVELDKKIQEKEEHLDKIKKSLVRIKERLG